MMMMGWIVDHKDILGIVMMKVGIFLIPVQHLQPVDPLVKNLNVTPVNNDKHSN